MPAVLKEIKTEGLLSKIDPKDRVLVWKDGVFSIPSFRSQVLPQGVALLLEEGGKNIRFSLSDKSILEETVWVLFSSPENGASQDFYSKLKISAGVSTRLNLILCYLGAQKNESRLKLEAEISLAENACVDLFGVEQADSFSQIETSHKFYLKKHSSVDGLIFTEGTSASVHKTVLEFLEPHGFASFKGLSVLKGDRKAAHNLMVSHQAPQCISRQYYKNILSGRSRGEFRSLVHVQKDAVKSDSEQLNRNLLLSQTASAHSQPELRIDHDDVAARHGSATGELQDTEIFYLRSRGLSERAAKELLIYGFAEEIVSQIHAGPLRQHVEQLLGADLTGISPQEGS